MITLSQYFGLWEEEATPEHRENAVVLLEAVNALLADVKKTAKFEVPINPKTKSQISGEVYGGFRPMDCSIGASKSTHKQGMGIDLFDPLKFRLAVYLNTYQDILVKHGLYMESPNKTPAWCHLQTRKTRNRVFIP